MTKLELSLGLLSMKAQGPLAVWLGAALVVIVVGLAVVF